MEKEELEVRSLASCSARSSTVSSASIAAAKARAKAEAAQARAAFSKKEMEIKIERARLEATLEALEREREAEAALAEAVVMEAAVVNLEAAEKEHRTLPIPVQSPQEATEEYVKGHIHFGSSLQLAREQANLPEDEELETKSVKSRANSVSRYPVDTETFVSGGLAEQKPHPTLLKSRSYPISPVATTPHSGNQTNAATHCSSDKVTSELAKYLARSQIVSSGLTRFNDQPEHFLSWKSSFINAIEGLDLNAGEEMDLLIKWLGTESAEHARCIKSVNVRNSSAGLKLTWERLEEMYGSPEAIEGALFAKIEKFPKIGPRDHLRLRELSDLLSEIEAAKQEGYLPGLSYLNTARGVNPIVDKLPYGLQEKWMMEGSLYKQEHRVAFPPFSFFLDFVHRQAKARNDPSFNLPSSYTASNKRDRFNENYSMPRKTVSVHKTDVPATRSAVPVNDPDKQCPLHHKPHPLKRCRGFREMPLDERKRIIKAHNICFKCCASNKHMARSCELAVKCSECDSDRHPTALHPGPAPWLSKTSSPQTQQGGEEEKEVPEADVTSKCTEVCGEGFRGRSCSKICLVKVYPAGCHRKGRTMYAILDDQSNRSLARTEFFNMFGIDGPMSPYTLKTCSGVAETAGRWATGYIVESADGAISFPLPTLLECNMIPNNRNEIPTPAVAQSHYHLRKIATEIPPLDPAAEILLLLGRDILRVHKARKLINGPHDAPYAQKLDLGWVIIGDVCLGRAHRPIEVTSMKTHVLENGRPSLFQPCKNHMTVKENFSKQHQPFKHTASEKISVCASDEKFGQSVFRQTKHDNKLALSMEDMLFLRTMEKEVFQDSSNSWVAPLPFRKPRKLLPNNRSYAMCRFKSLYCTLEKHPVMKSHFTEFMQKILDSHHAELAPPVQEGKEYWYLPFFGVYHPQKPSQIRVVFDSSAQFEGISLNDVLLSGPDMNNSLLGVLIRFRKNPVAITADIQQMFHCFLVREDCRDVLRFLWHKDNDPHKEVVDYRMRVHVFRNSPSPAVAIYGLRRAAQEGEKEFGSDVRHFVERNFYMDDALQSVSTEEEAINLLKRTQDMLATSNLRLHKVASNKCGVMDAIPVEDRAKDLQDLNLFVDDLPDQRTLGVKWSIKSDLITFHVPEIERPYTRRGVLSVVNSIFDPEHPFILTPSMLLTQRAGTTSTPKCDFSQNELLKHQWKRVQYLAEEFWNRWRKEYLTTLQPRQKWQQKRPDIKEGDVVLLKEKQVRRNEWPMGVVVNTVLSKDGLVRKAEIKVVHEGVTKIFYRPITEMVLLLSPV